MLILETIKSLETSHLDTLTTEDLHAWADWLKEANRILAE